MCLSVSDLGYKRAVCLFAYPSVKPTMFIITTSHCLALQHHTLYAYPLSWFCACLTSMCTSLAPKYLLTRLHISNKDDGKMFVCNEVLHISSEQCYRYYPISLEQKLTKGKIEIGWTGYSSVWPMCAIKWVHDFFLASIQFVYKGCNTRNAKYVAVKTPTTNATAGVMNGLWGRCA